MSQTREGWWCVVTERWKGMVFFASWVMIMDTLGSMAQRWKAFLTTSRKGRWTLILMSARYVGHPFFFLLLCDISHKSDHVLIFFLQISAFAIWKFYSTTLRCQFHHSSHTHRCTFNCLLNRTRTQTHKYKMKTQTNINAWSCLLATLQSPSLSSPGSFFYARIRFVDNLECRLTGKLRSKLKGLTVAASTIAVSAAATLVACPQPPSVHLPRPLLFI